MSGDSLLKMFLVLQYLRRLDALALHYCRWDCIGKGAKSEVMRATIYVMGSVYHALCNLTS